MNIHNELFARARTTELIITGHEYSKFLRKHFEGKNPSIAALKAATAMFTEQYKSVFAPSNDVSDEDTALHVYLMKVRNSSVKCLQEIVNKYLNSAQEAPTPDKVAMDITAAIAYASANFIELLLDVTHEVMESSTTLFE